MLKIYLCEDSDEQRAHLKKVIENVVLMENLDMQLSCVTEDPYTLLDAAKSEDNVGVYLKDNPDEMDRRVAECILQAGERFSAANNKTQPNYSIRVGEKVYTVDYDEILFFETSANVHKIILHCKTRQLEFIGKIKDIEKELDKRFYRCHKSYLVNTDNIKEVDSGENIIRMVNGDECLLSFRKTKGLKELLKSK